MNRMESGTVLGRSTMMRGELSGTEDLSIEGEFEGLVRLTGSKLTIESGAHARARISAQDVVVFGRVDGEIRATGSVSLRDGSVVVGDILAARISIEENAVLHGRVDPSRAGEPFPVTQASILSPPNAGAPEELRLMPPVATQPLTRGLSPALNLFGKPEEPASSLSQMPAGLAAAARHFGTTSSSPASEGTSSTGASSGESPELAETKA